MISYHKIYMSPVQSSNLQSQLCALWKKQKFCDAVIKSDNISVMAHRLVLAASCPMLQSMENYSFGSLLEIRVESDMTKESVMAFLQYLYEGYLMLTEENYCHVEKLARSMHIDSIISCCKDFSQSILSSHSNIQGPTDQADFKHVRITNLLRVLDSSQKRLHESSVDHYFSKRLKQSSSDHCSSESISVKQETPLGATQSQGGGRGGTELRPGPSASDQSESYLTSSNKVSLNTNSEKAAASDDGVIFLSNANFKEGSSTSLNSTGPPPVQTSGRGSQLHGCPLTPTISNVHSLQTVQLSNSEFWKKTPQAEPYPVLLKEVRQSSSPFSCNSAKVSASCAGIDKDDERSVSSQSSSLQQQFIVSSRKFREKSESNSGTSTDPSAEVSLSIVKVEPEDSIIQTDEGMFLSTAQRDETQTSQSSWLHDNPSMSSEENSGQEETSSSLTSRTGLNKLSFSQLDTVNENRSSFGAFESDMFNVKMEEAYLAPIDESTTQFRAPVTQAGLVPGQDNSNTKSNTKWSLNVFEKWRESRSEKVPDFHLMNSKEMSFWLEQFVVEVKKLDGTEYPSKSIYLILCGLHRHLRENGIYDKNFLDEKNVYFARFRKVLNARMRTLNEKGLGLTVKRADPILPEQEDKLWEKGVFGQGSGEQLQLTIFFYVCKLFGLRTREDHHLLNVDQFSVGEDGDGRFINFVGRSSKTDNKGESGQLSVQSKSIKYYSKPDEDRDQVTLENGSDLESGSFVGEKSLLEISCGETGAMANLFSEIDRQTEIAIQSIMAGDSKVEPASRSEIINCTVCDKIFSTKYGHKMHMERFHPETLTKKSQKKYPKCKTCGKQMASKYALSIHEIKHTGAKYFKCKQCGTQFGYKHVLKNHMEVCGRAKTSKR